MAAVIKARRDTRQDKSPDLKVPSDFTQMSSIYVSIFGIVGSAVAIRTNRDDPLGIIGSTIGKSPYVVYF